MSEPTFKNSLINYLELRRNRGQLSKAVLATLESRAVNDLTLVDVEAAVNQKRMIHASYALTAVIVVFCLYWAFAPKSPLRLDPTRFLADVAPPTNTQLVNIKPGDNTELADVVAGTSVNFEVDVQGVGRRRSCSITASMAGSSSPSRSSRRGNISSTPGSIR